MKEALALLNRILEASTPGETIRLPLKQAREFAALQVRDLGYSLFSRIRIASPERALAELGLFGRNVMIVLDSDNFVVEERSWLRPAA